MNMKFAKTATTIIVALSAMVSAETLTGRDIVQKVHDRPDGDTRSSELSMTLINKSGAKRERKITSFAMDVGKDTKQIMFFRYPNDVKGTGFLTVDYDDINKDDDKWLYLPAMKKTRRISGKSSKTDYFMGSDFTYDDVGQRNIDEDTHKLLREEKVNGIDCWVVESVPKKGDEIFSKKISWIRKDCLIAAKVEYYDKLGKLHRALKVENVVQVDGFWSIAKMSMENVQTNHKTLLEFGDIKFNIPLDAKTFTVPRLERGL
nr:outer membrane lipoprotein-sorting protein [uncultured Fibrobacter sp.]